MTIRDLLLHMAQEQYVEIYIGQSKEFEGYAGEALLGIPNSVTYKKAKQICSMDCATKPRVEGLYDNSMIAIIANA